MFDESALLTLFYPCTVVHNKVFCLLCVQESFTSMAFLCKTLLVVFFLFDFLCLPLTSSASARRLMLIGLRLRCRVASARRLMLIGLRLRCRVSRTIKYMCLSPRLINKRKVSSFQLVTVTVRNLTTFWCCKNVCFRLCIDTKQVSVTFFHVFLRAPIIRTFWHFSLLAVLLNGINLHLKRNKITFRGTRSFCKKSATLTINAQLRTSNL